MNVEYLIQVAKGKVVDKSLSKERAIQLLGANRQSASIQGLVGLLQEADIAQAAVNTLLETVYLFDAYYQVVDHYQSGNPWALQLLKGWAEKSWLHKTQALPNSIEAIVLKVDGAITAAMLSPMSAAFTRSDVALHAQSLLAEHMPEARALIDQLKASGYPVILVADKIDTTHASLSHRQSAVQALLWHIGVRDTLSVGRGIILSEQIDPHFYDMAERFGTLLLRLSVNSLRTGDKVCVKPYQGVVLNKEESIPFTADQSHWQSIWRMGGRTQFMLGESLTRKAKACLVQATQNSPVVREAAFVKHSRSYTLAQKMIGKACGLSGVTPKTVCAVTVDTVAIHSSTVKGTENNASPDFFADLVVKSAKETNSSQGELVIQPREGRLQAWVSRLLVPDTVNLSEDAYARYPLGLTLSAGVAETHQASRTALISLTVPESVLIRFSGEKPAAIRLRDIINAISYAITHQVSTAVNNHLERIVEIQGLDFLTVAEAYELTEDSVSYSSVACTVALSEHNVLTALHQSTDWLSQFIKDKYPHHLALQRRLNQLNHWIAHPQLLKADEHASYAQIIRIALETLKEPLLASIEDTALVLSLSEAAKLQTCIDTVWIGSSATHLEHYRIVAKLLQRHPHRLKSQLWIAPPSTMELKQLMQEGCYQVYGRRGVYTQMPENALCTDAYFQPGSTVVATSSRAFLNSAKRQWKGYIASPELATITALLGRLPSLYEYQSMLVDE